MAVHQKSFAVGAGYSDYQIQYSVESDQRSYNNGFFTINKTFLPAKIFYFLFMGSMVSFMPFAPVYMEQLGLNSFQIGIIGATQPVGTLLACPFWGAVADKFSIHRLVVLMGIIVGCTATTATYFTPSSVNATLNSTIEPTPPPLSWDQTYLTFTIMMVLSVVSISFLAEVNAIIDSNILELLKNNPQTDYGRQRVWGAVGWGTFSGLTGLAMDTYIKYYPDGNCFLPAYIIFTAMMAPAVIPVLIMKFPSHTKPESIAVGLFKLFKSIRVLIFLFIATVCGLSLGVISTYQFLFLKELNGPSLVMGLTLTFTCLSEIPFMFISGRLLKFFGHETVFSIALFCYCLRFFLYSILKNPWLILPIELLHGICFGALWPAATSFADKIAPPGMGATVQNLMTAVSLGLGSWHRYHRRGICIQQVRCQNTLLLLWSPLWCYYNFLYCLCSSRSPYEKVQKFSNRLRSALKF
ncbi:Major facilitator superfamily domain-containing protein 6 [Holothuria leucospilota]|uniref:Major facilitator superfamily domain-containing protein 6 n=1 Tax=Holothuria leucospilota TaxID=206669 RepID=A0A9Q1BK68_HOLLE|nr:Major facilitator superfamily domain-containing protein 6 [Holothuria leucospilota]